MKVNNNFKDRKRQISILSSCVSHCFITVLNFFQCAYSVLGWSFPGSVACSSFSSFIIFFTIAYVLWLAEDDIVMCFHSHITISLKIRFFCKHHLLIEKIIFLGTKGRGKLTGNILKQKTEGTLIKGLCKLPSTSDLISEISIFILR